MLSRKPSFASRSPSPPAAGLSAIVIAGGGFAIVSATSGGASTVATAAASFPARGSNARSGPAAGGSIGTVSGASASGFMLTTSAGQKEKVKMTSCTTYQDGPAPASASVVTGGEPALVLGTTDSTTITAGEVIVNPPDTGSSQSSQVVPFQRGSSSTSKTVGQVPSSYKEGSGTIVSGTTAYQATKAALDAYPGGVVDRVVKLSNGEYEVHNIGVNWPHHIFVNQDFNVVGAN